MAYLIQRVQEDVKKVEEDLPRVEEDVEIWIFAKELESQQKLEKPKTN